MEKGIMINLTLNVKEAELLTRSLNLMSDYLEQLNAMQMLCNNERTALKDAAVLGGIFQKLIAATSDAEKAIQEDA